MKNGHPLSTTARQFNIPRSTLLYKSNGKLAENFKKPGPECILSIKDEECLLEWIFYMSDRGFPISRDQLLDSVKILLDAVKKKTVFTKNRPGRHWYEGFCRRHPQLSQRMSQNLTYARSSLTEGKIRGWFKKVKIYLTEKNLLGIDGQRIFNCDESAFLLAPKAGKVLVKVTDKTAYNFINNDEKECLTTLFCGNAAGQLAPPMVMFNYVRIPANIAKKMPKSWGIGRSESGWMTSETFYEYIANVFHPWLVNNKVEFPVILYLDGHSSHMTLALSNLCKDLQIELIALHPNATHILQPMDVAVFHPLKTKWLKTLREWRLENEVVKLTRDNFGPVLNTAMSQLDFQQVLKNGFRTTGLFPFSADGINYNKFFKDSVTQVPTFASDNITLHNQKLLKFVEDNIPHDILQLFKRGEDDDEWLGDIQHKSLFHFWKKAKSLVLQTEGPDKENNEEDVQVVLGII